MTTTFETTRQAFIRKIRLINWHGHENATFEVNGGMLAVIGENGSGKSLVLDAIDWALFPAPSKQFNAAAREGGRTSRRTLSNTILFFDPHGVDRPDHGWRRGRTVGFAACEVEHDNGEHWTYGSAAAATPHSAHPWYYALPGSVERVHFLQETPQGRVPLQYPEFRKANETLVNHGGEIYSGSQVEEYNRAVARRLLNIEGSDWERRYDALYDVLHRMLGLKVDDSLVADPSSVVRQFLPVVDRPHLERLVEGLEGIQHIHRDIEEYGKLRDCLRGVVEARRKYYETVVQYGALAWLRASWAEEDRTKALEQAEIARAEARAASAKAEADEEAAYTEEAAARRELEALQQLHQGEIVQAVTRANAGVQSATREQERAAREQRQADERLNRAEQVVTASLGALNQEQQTTRARIKDLRLRAREALGNLTEPVESLFERLGETPGDEGTADALHQAAQQLDRQLSEMAAQVEQLAGARRAVETARQAERDARARHTANETAATRARQALRGRWERLTQRWPRDLTPGPTGEPAPQVLPALIDLAASGREAARAAASEANARITRLGIQLDELGKRMAGVDGELGRPVTEARPRLSPDRERALQQILTVDRGAAALFQQLDFKREVGPFAEAIEGLLAHVDFLTAVQLSSPVTTLRGALVGQTDWHALSGVAPAATVQGGTVAAMLECASSPLRAAIDGTFGSCVLAQEPAASGDYLCPDGRYQLGTLAGQVPLSAKTNQLIGSQRRQQAAAAHRAELLAERDGLRQQAAALQQEIAAAKEAAGDGDDRARRLDDALHLLEEIRARLVEAQDTLNALDESTQAIADAQRTLAETDSIANTLLEQWKLAVGPFTALTDPARLAPARPAVAQAVADALNRATEARTRLAQLQTRLRGAEEARTAEAEAFGQARAHLAQADRDVDEAKRILAAARGSLRQAGLENVEQRMTELQQRLRAAQERARQLGVQRGVTLHQLEAAQIRFDNATQESQAAAKQMAERNQHFAALLGAVESGLKLAEAAMSDPPRYARQLTRGRDSRARLEEDLPRAFAASEREQEGFLAAIAEYQAMVGIDDKFGLRQPSKVALALAPQSVLMDVHPRREGATDITLLLEFLDVSIEQLKQTLTERVTKVVRDIILGEVVSHLVEQLVRADDIIAALNERLVSARFFARNTRFSLKLAVRLARHPDIPFDHVAVATALVEHGRSMPSAIREELTKIFATWLDEQMRAQTQPSVEAIVEQLDYRRWVDITLLHADDHDARVRPWDSAVSGFGSGGEQRVPVYVLLITAAAMQFAVSNAPLRLLMHDEAFARMDQRNADLVVRFAQQLGVGLVIASPNLDLFAEGVKYATAYRLRQLPSGLIAREALHLKSAENMGNALSVRNTAAGTTSLAEVGN